MLYLYGGRIRSSSRLIPAIGCLGLALQVGRDMGYLQRGSGRDEEAIRFDPVPHEFVTWSMPAHDLRRPEDKKCGFIRSPSGSIVYTMCPDHPKHHLKGKRRRFSSTVSV